MDVFGALKIGNGNASEIKEVLWLATISKMDAGVAAAATAAFSAAAPGIRPYHKVELVKDGLWLSGAGLIIQSVNCTANDVVGLTAYNSRSAAAVSASAAETWIVRGWR